MITIVHRWGDSGGHGLTFTAEVADGHLVAERVWQHVLDERQPGRVLDAVLVRQTVWIGNAMVRDPAWALKLIAEATGDGDD